MDGDTFNFITPVSLRNNISDSVKFATFLWTLAQGVEAEYQDEMVRTVILYNISIIEALLLFRAKRQKLDFYDYTYSNLTALPRVFWPKDQETVVTFRKKQERDESKILLHELIREQESFLGKSLHKEIIALQNIRNTFHLSRPRDVLSFKKATASFDVVLKLAKKIQREASKK